MARPQAPLTRAALYVRASSAGQVDKSIPAQVAECQSYALAQGWTVVRVFKDEGISAFKDVARAGYDEMLQAAEAGVFDTLLVWNTDRLTRKSGSQGLLALRWMLQAVGVEIASVTQPTIADEFAAGLMAYVEGHRAQQESAAKSASVKRGLAQRAAKGLPNGRLPYGYTSKGGEMVPDPLSAHVVARVFEEFVAGESQSEIARQLDAEGIPSKNGGRWHQGTIRQMLVNPTYKGVVPFKGELIPGQHAPLVTEELWNAAQLLMHGKHRAKPERRGGGIPGTGGRISKAHLLSRLLVCGECGEAMMSRYGALRRDGTRYETYVCPNHAGRYGSDCPMPPLSRGAVDSAVLAHFQEHVVDQEATRRQFDGARSALLDRLSKDAALAKARVDETRRSYERAWSDYDKGVLSGEVYTAREPELKAAREQAQAALDAVLDRLHQAQQEPEPDVETKVLAELTALAEAVKYGLDEAGDRIATLRAQLSLVFLRFEVHLGRVELGDMPDYGPGLPPGLRPGQSIPEDPGEAALEERLAKERKAARTEDPEDLIGVGEVTIFPVLRAERIEAFGADFQPVAARVPLTLPPPAKRTGGWPRGDDDPDPDDGTPAKPTGPVLDGPSGSNNSKESPEEQAKDDADRYGQSDVTGFGTKSSAPRPMPRTAACGLASPEIRRIGMPASQPPSGAPSRMRVTRSRPLMPGRPTSTTAASGRARPSSSTASSALVAGIGAKRSAERFSARKSRVARSSSTRRTDGTTRPSPTDMTDLRATRPAAPVAADPHTHESRGGPESPPGRHRFPARCGNRVTVQARPWGDPGRAQRAGGQLHDRRGAPAPGHPPRRERVAHLQHHAVGVEERAPDRRPQPGRVDARAAGKPERLAGGEVWRAEQADQARAAGVGQVATGGEHRGPPAQRRRRAGQAVDAQAPHAAMLAGPSGAAALCAGRRHGPGADPCRPCPSSAPSRTSRGVSRLHRIAMQRPRPRR